MLTVGKVSVVDIFDTNKYAHDPRNDFLNWAIVDAGTFDYAADAWGTTYGAAAEWYQDWWAVRLGVFDLSNVPNSIHLGLPLFQQTQFIAELEERHTLWDQPGKLKFLYWLDTRRTGTVRGCARTGRGDRHDAVNGAAVRNYRSKYGIVLNLEQQLTADLGLFARAGWSQGSVEEDDFTDINQTLSIGLSLAGTRWGRPDDTVGLAGVANQISHAGQAVSRRGRPGWDHRRRPTAGGRPGTNHRNVL